MDKNKVVKFFTGFGIGLVIGGIVAILTAPLPGKQLRVKIGDKLGELKDRGRRAIHPEKYTRIK
jgi:gas vesicle protein